MVGRALLTAMWFAVLVPPAQAATKVEVVSARLIDERGIDHSTSELIVRGDDAGGELRLTSGAGGAVTVSDTAGVTVGKDCALQADGSARCAFPYVLTRIDVEAAGGDDHVIVAAPSAAVSGGPGADTLEGYVPATELGSFFDGGPGDDVIRGSGTLVGGPGRDVLLGGPGSDFLNGDGGAPLEPDVIDGGDGRSDWVLFAGASEAVASDAGASDAGFAPLPWRDQRCRRRSPVARPADAAGASTAGAARSSTVSSMTSSRRSGAKVVTTWRTAGTSNSPSGPSRTT